MGVPSLRITPRAVNLSPERETRATNDLSCMLRHRSLGPFHLAVDHLAAERAVPARLILAEVLILLRVNLRQPLHVGDAVPAGHDQSEREALVLGERLAVHQVSEDRFTRERLLAREAAAELLVDA